MRKKLYIGALIFICSIIVQYISMYDFKDHTSAVDMKSWLIETVIFYSFLITIILFLIFHFSKKLNSTFSFILEFTCTSLSWFYFSYCLFTEYESAWSTYLFEEELYHVYRYSRIYIILFAPILIFSKNKILTK